MTLEKAVLKAMDSGAQDIEFMFNPNELSISRSVNIEQPAGARTSSGNNKTSFKYPNPYSLSINNIILDTYETGTNVLTYVGKFTAAVEFTQMDTANNQKRPPIYLFTWGDHEYIRCFVKNFSCKLTLFLPDGTPVRASVDLSLEQVDPPTPNQSQSPNNPPAGSREDSNFFLGN
jgi:hypothetical protein